MRLRRGLLIVIAVLVVWRVLVPVTYCPQTDAAGFTREVRIGRVLPWLPDCSSLIGDIAGLSSFPNHRATVLHVALLASLAYIVWRGVK